MKRTLSLLSFLVLAACGGISSDNDSGGDESENWNYNFTENGCSTGAISGVGRAAQCEALGDDARNNFCAKALRQQSYAQLCGNNQGGNGGDGPLPLPGPDDNNGGNNGGNGGGPDLQKVCGYKFTAAANPIVVKAVLQGTWASRSPGLLTENGVNGSRSYKTGFFFNFDEKLIDDVRVYYQLEGADLKEVAISKPATVDDIKISEAVTDGEYKDWHLVQWQTGPDACHTIAVGQERREGELDNTLLVIGPVRFMGAGDVNPPTITDFFKLHTRKDAYFRTTSDELARWDAQGL